MPKSRFWKDRQFNIDIHHKYTFDELNERQKRMLSCQKDLSGTRQGRLYVIEFGYILNHCVYYKCKCDCGNMVFIRKNSLKRGQLSCGCLTKELLMKHAKSQKNHNEPYWYDLKAIWYDIIRRCHNPKSHLDDKRLYQDKGIVVCDEWRNDFKAFYDWSIANGYTNEKMDSGINKLSIDRIDYTKGYSPDNCRWTDWKTQRRNQERYIKYGL